VLHPEVLGSMLDDEISVAEERLAGRSSAIWRVGPLVYCAPHRDVGSWRIRLDGRTYDATPFRLAFVDEELEPLDTAMWPNGTSAGIHQVLDVPWMCIAETYEYYLHPGHHTETWDSIRSEKRLAETLSHILRRCGQ
jgi:hypothetical protein